MIVAPSVTPYAALISSPPRYSTLLQSPSFLTSTPLRLQPARQVAYASRCKNLPLTARCWLGCNCHQLRRRFRCLERRFRRTKDPADRLLWISHICALHPTIVEKNRPTGKTWLQEMPRILDRLRLHPSQQTTSSRCFLLRSMAFETLQRVLLCLSSHLRRQSLTTFVLSSKRICFERT